MASINGWPCSGRPSTINIRTYRVPGTTTTLPLRSDAAPLLLGFATEFHTKVEPLRKGWCWGYAFRSIRGSIKPSYHGAGIAIDLNAPRHPLGKRNTFTPRQAATIRALCKKYGLRWGGDYRLRKDEMHMELILNPAQTRARIAALRASRTRPPAPATPTSPAPVGPPAHLPKHATGSRVLRRGMKGTDVWNVQNGLRTIFGSAAIIRDGDYGPATERVVRKYQTIRKLGVDGKVGPGTLGAIRKDLAIIAARRK